MTTNQPISDGEVARQLHERSGSLTPWDQLPDDTRRDFIIRACQLTDLRKRELREEDARRVKYAAADAYRDQIVTTVPAHRLDTRQNGFLDGWDAAMAHIAAQQAL